MGRSGLWLLLGCVGARVACAAPISLDDFSGSESVDGFEGGFAWSDATITRPGFALEESGAGGPSGLAAVEGHAPLFAAFANASGGHALQDYRRASSIHIAFFDSVDRAGMLVAPANAATFALTAYGASGEELETVFAAAGPALAAFIGVERPERIASLRLWEPNGANASMTVVDDVRFEYAPESAGLIAVALGLLAVARRRRPPG